MHRSLRPFSSLVVLLVGFGTVCLPACSSSDDVIPPPALDAAADAGVKSEAATDAGAGDAALAEAGADTAPD